MMESQDEDLQFDEQPRALWTLSPVLRHSPNPVALLLQLEEEAAAARAKYH